MLQATASEELAQGPYVAARAGFERHRLDQCATTPHVVAHWKSTGVMKFGGSARFWLRDEAVERSFSPYSPLHRSMWIKLGNHFNLHTAYTLMQLCYKYLSHKQ